MPTLVGERTYELSRLLRGQAGTEWAMADPLPAGAPFVLLDEHVTAIARGLDALGQTMQLRVIAAGRDHGDPAAVALTATPQATALRPLAPVHLRARRTGDGVTFTWIRRTRRDGDSWDAIEVPLGEASEAYELDVLDGATVKRTLTARHAVGALRGGRRDRRFRRAADEPLASASRNSPPPSAAATAAEATLTP